MPEGYPPPRPRPVGAVGRAHRFVPQSGRATRGEATDDERRTSDARHRTDGAVVAREHRVTASIEVHAPVEVIWDVLTRFSDYGDWLESTTEVLRADDDAVVGASFEERSRISGVWMATIRWTVTELHPQERLAFRGEGVRLLDGLGFAVDLTAEDDATALSLTLWYTPRYGAVGSALDVLTRSNVTNDQKRSVRTLAMLAERIAHGDAELPDLD